MTEIASDLFQFSQAMMTSAEQFKWRIRPFLNMQLELVIHENRSTMLNLLEKKGKVARLSVHKMFLQAPESVLSAIAHYVRGTRKEIRERNQVLRQYIQHHLAHADYTHLVDRQKLNQKGQCYDLQLLYQSINLEYFEGKLDLSITWFRTIKRTRYKRITFGQYLSGLKLIKINNLLDDPFFPDYFVEFVVYHEMLHSVVPGSVDSRGRFCFHNKDFKSKEKAFKQYERAILWEKNNKIKLFKYGWT